MNLHKASGSRRVVAEIFCWVCPCVCFVFIWGSPAFMDISVKVPKTAVGAQNGVDEEQT